MKQYSQMVSNIIVIVVAAIVIVTFTSNEAIFSTLSPLYEYFHQ